MKNAIVVGGSGGIGLAIVQVLVERFEGVQVFATYCHSDPRGSNSNPSNNSQSHSMEGVSGVTWLYCDVSEEASVSGLVDKIRESSDGPIDLIVNAVGILHKNDLQPEKSLRQVNEEFFLTNMRMNVLPSLFLAKYLSVLLKKSPYAIFATVSAKVGSIEDNRLGGWTSYRCSKAALNMAMKNISIEWQRTLPNVCVLALHPGTTDTLLSKPFQSNVPSNKLFTTKQTANYLLDVMNGVSIEDTGSFFSWNGEKIPW